jgi:outer membrane protein assembly factor BamD (BamD/ComL family)
MTALRSLHLVVATCWTLVYCGCAPVPAGYTSTSIFSNRAQAPETGNALAGQPALPAAGAKDTVTYEPPVPVTSLPAGEPRPDPATGWARFNYDHFTETFKTAIGRGPNESVARLYYSQGDALYRQKKYHDAAKKYADAADRLPDSTLEECALFMEGEAWFFADQYGKSNDAYGELAKKYSNTRFMNVVVARQFAIAVYWEQYAKFKPEFILTPNFFDKTRPLFDTWGNAIRDYDMVRINDPRGPYADEAIMRTANAHFVKHHYEDADYSYTLLRKDYPKSKHQVDAHVLGIQAKLRRYEGPGYDDRPLKQAEELIDQTLAQFGSELGAERDRLVTAKAEIHAQQALRNWTVAQYYEKGEHYAAAKVYYNEIVKEYPQTKLADQARTRLVALGPLPDNPPNRFKILEDIFDGGDADAVIARQSPPDGTSRR